MEAMLSTLSENAQHASLFTFVQREAAEAQQHAELLRQQAQMLAQANRSQPILVDRTTPRAEFVKIDVAKYSGSDTQSLLRWLVELEAAIHARNISSPLMQAAFAMSNLAGRAKTWAFGRRLADSSCFSTYAEFRGKPSSLRRRNSEHALNSWI